MKILILANKFPYPPKDGGSIATFRLISDLSALRHTVTVLAINTTKHHFDTKQLPADVRKIAHFIGIDVNTDIVFGKAFRNLLFSDLPYNADRFISKDYATELSLILQENEFDVIQLEGLYMMPYVSIIRKLTKSIVSLRAHNIEHEIWHRMIAQETNFFRKWYMEILGIRIKRMEINMLNKYDVLVPITERDAKLFYKLGNIKPTFVTPTGFDTKSLRIDNSNTDFPSLFHLGALDWSPNLEGLLWFFVHCWHPIIEKYPRLRFYLGGRNAPQWFVHALNFENVEYCGEVEDACDFMNSKSIMVVPLLSGSGIRIKIIEGMSLGKTIITTTVGTEGIPTTHNHNILIANTPEQFITEIERIINNRTLCDQIGENARHFAAENFDNRKMTEKLLDFYQKRIKQ